MTNLMRLVLIFIAVVFIGAGLFTAFCHFTNNTDLLPPFLQGDATVEDVIK